MLDKICTEELHTCDVISCVFHNGYIYTGGDDGHIKVYTEDLKAVLSWKAHEQVVYDLAVNPNKGDIYSCSLDGQILQWRIDLQSKHAQLINSATQTLYRDFKFPYVFDPITSDGGHIWLLTSLQSFITSFSNLLGPSGKGQGLPGVGEVGSLEDSPANVRKLFWRGDHLYAGDELGSICRWTEDLKLELKQEYFTEIWCLYVNEDESLIYSGRDNDIVIASLPQKASLEARCVQVKGNLAGRCPVVANKDDSIIAIVNRNGMQVDIWSNKDGNERTKIQTLKDHDMIVNCINMDPSDQTLITAGWDAKVNFWKRGEDGVYSLTKSVKDMPFKLFSPRFFRKYLAGLKTTKVEKEPHFLNNPKQQPR